MSTRSLICKEVDGNPNNYVGIYCHWDGYPEGVGEILLHYYTDRGKLDELLSLGSISELGQLVAPPESVRHTFKDPCPGVTVAYHRDRGETLSPARRIEIDAAKEKYGAEYIYVYTLDNKWVFARCYPYYGNDIIFSPLTEEVVA